MRNFCFGLDFGTSKTAIALAEADINSQVEVLAIDQNHKERIPTCVLLRDRDTDKEQVWIGQEAEDEMRLESNPTLARLEFFANFKPHIHQTQQACEVARRFMTAMARAEGVSSELRRHGHDAIVAAGSPVSWQADGEETLLNILGSAGFPPAYTVPEPVGAALYFYTARKLKAQDLQRDIVVFDWGAGTFDLTLLRAGQIKIHSNWGSAVYGGRLFDDLFFQWMLDIAENNGHRKDVEELNRRPVERRYLHGFICREIKESFSAAYATAYAKKDQDRAWTYKHTVTIGVGKNMIDLGNFAVPRLSEFYDRARMYRATDLARPWLQQPPDKVLPAERDYLDTLLNGGAVDLVSWGKAVVGDGLKALGVGSKAIAVLTGGSCNWQWFKDFVCTLDAFKGDEDNVHIDLKPELTIARGLARACAVGRYSKQLIEQIERERARLIPLLSELHGEPLHELSYSINAEMRNDKTLQQEVRRIFAVSYRDALTAARPVHDGGRLGQMTGLVKVFVRSVISETPAELALRNELQQTIAAWLSSHEPILRRRWGEKFADTAHDKIMTLLKKHLDLKGLVEVAVSACGATGPMTFQGALQKLGSQVNIGSAIVMRLHRELSKLWRQLINADNSTDITATRIEEQSKASAEHFFDHMPADIRRTIATVQPAKQWAHGLVDDLIGTLKTVAEFARADAAERISQA